MAPLPKRKHSTRRQGKRRAALKLTLPLSMTCANCGSLRLPHRVCGNCGFYGGKAVVIKKVKTKKKSK